MENGQPTQILCEEPKFDNRVCITVDEYTQHLKDIETAKSACLKWKPTAEPKVSAYIGQMRKDLNEAISVAR